METPTTPPSATVSGAHRAVRPRRFRRAFSTLLFLTLPVGLAAAVLTVPAVDAPMPSTDLAPAAQAVPSAPLRTFTLNVRFDLSKEQARADIDRGMTLGDVGGFQEMSEAEDRQTLIEVAALRDYGYYMPPEGGLAIPIVWNRARFRLIDGHTTLTHGPVPGSPSRYVNVVRLRELATGKIFGFVNTHAISNASFDAQLSDMSKIPLLRNHLQVLRNEILGLFASTEFVFASGDLNVNYLADRNRKNAGLPTSALGDVVNFDMPLTGSRGEGSLLDYGMSVKNNGGLALASSTIVYGFNSDHDAVQFLYNPVNLFTEGPLFSNPKGTSYDKRAVLDRQVRALAGTEIGATVRLVTTKIDEQSVTDQLVAARTRGVNVQVVLGPGGGTGQEAVLAAALGTDTLQPSWVKRCSDGCLGDARSTQSTFMLVDRTQGTTNLSLVASGPVLAKGTRTFTDMFVSTDDALHAAYAGLFARFASDSPAPDNTRTVTAGTHQIQLYPTVKDPVATSLSRVKCTNAKGLRVKNGRTNVRVQVSSWSGQRGKQLAERLGILKRQGCTVQVLTGQKVNSRIKAILRENGVSRRAAKVAQNLLVVDGRYRKKNKVSTAWTAGPYWTDGALKSDGTTLVVTEAAAVRSYLDDFARIWRASK
ncbi:MAG: hypothetical protein LH468_03900 [Nocardioides sp.]|nr:hypothetical protein [Nocardioides sp.]